MVLVCNDVQGTFGRSEYAGIGGKEAAGNGSKVSRSFAPSILIFTADGKADKPCVRREGEGFSLFEFGVKKPSTLMAQDCTIAGSWGRKVCTITLPLGK